MTWFINYIESDSISVSDRGFSYGDGLFETLLLDNGKILTPQFHQERLLRGCQRLALPFTYDELQKAFCFAEKQASSYDKVCVKFIISRGSGGRGYMPPDQPNITLAIGILPAPDYRHLAKQGVKIAISDIKSSMNSSLSGLKHLNRLENVLAKQELAQLNLHDDAIFEAVLLDDNKHLVECIQSNLFWFKNDVLYTPLLNKSGVQGTMRARIFSLSKYQINVGQYSLNDLLTADEVFICNSLMTVVPVISIRTQAGTVTFKRSKNIKQLQSLLKQN
ncbi:aminodeoxychorismate lyase [Marinomonas sp. PE14-40]|uniref:aminodeoxychorismate lyase n=1 Tax=Marinomonas sp. PE14-40 TaxID=3060621 RepID=UPI003F67BEA2